MEMKPQEDEAAKVVTCKGCGAELKAYAYGKNLYVCPPLRTLRTTARAHAHPSDRG